MLLYVYYNYMIKVLVGFLFIKTYIKNEYFESIAFKNYLSKLFNANFIIIKRVF